jgi:predicted SAM-dependent methyltransferase
MVKINMMCGKRNFGPDWVHVDMSTGYDHVTHKDITLSSWHSIDLIYCSHGIAYFDLEEIKVLFSQWKRALRPGGTLRLATPDWNELRILDYPLLGPLYGKMHEPPIYHKMVWCYDSLWKALTDAGFINIERYDHTKTEHPNTGNRADFYDDCSAAYYFGKPISLNVQCIKP